MPNSPLVSPIPGQPASNTLPDLPQPGMSFAGLGQQRPQAPTVPPPQASPMSASQSYSAAPSTPPPADVEYTKNDIQKMKAQGMVPSQIMSVLTRTNSTMSGSYHDAMKTALADKGQDWVNNYFDQQSLNHFFPDLKQAIPLDPLSEKLAGHITSGSQPPPSPSAWDQFNGGIDSAVLGAGHFLYDPATWAAGKAIGAIPGMQNNQTVQGITDQAGQRMQSAAPEYAGTLAAVATGGMGIPAEMGAAGVAAGLTKAGQNLSEDKAAGNAPSIAREVSDPTVRGIENALGVGLPAGIAKGLEALSPEARQAIVRGLALKITGGADEKTVQGTIKSLPSVDTSGVKKGSPTAYNDLSKAIDSHTTNLQAQKVAAMDAANSTDTPLKKFEIVSRSKNGEVNKVNPVVNALNELGKFYRDSADVAARTKIDNLEMKAEKTGLKPSEVDSLAAEYNSVFGSKAYKENGYPIKGMTAARVENTRVDLKNAARNLLPPEVAKVTTAMDKEQSNLIATSRAAKDYQDAVNSSSATKNEGSSVAKGASKVIKGIDMATMGGLGGTVRGLVHAAGNDVTVPATEMGSTLGQNLQNFQYHSSKLQ